MAGDRAVVGKVETESGGWEQVEAYFAGHFTSSGRPAASISLSSGVKRFLHPVDDFSLSLTVESGTARASSGVVFQSIAGEGGGDTCAVVKGFMSGRGLQGLDLFCHL